MSLSPFRCLIPPKHELTHVSYQDLMTSVRYVLKLTGQLAKEIVVYDRGLVTRTEDPAIFAKPLLVAIVMEDGQTM